jgi:hypothetical protein
MDEIKFVDDYLRILDSSRVPNPLKIYINLLRERREPYYTIAKFVLSEALKEYNSGKLVYSINPRLIEQQLKEKIREEYKSKFTRRNISRCILALFYGNKRLKEEDYYATVTVRGRKNYHVFLNALVSSCLL